MTRGLEYPIEVDRRAHPRSPIVVRETRRISGIDVFFGYAQNISRGGAFIATPKKRMPGETHEIEFTLPGVDQTFLCQARVVWARSYRPGSPHPPGFGLEFIDLPEEDALVIDAWVHSTGGA